MALTAWDFVSNADKHEVEVTPKAGG